MFPQVSETAKMDDHWTQDQNSTEGRRQIKGFQEKERGNSMDGSLLHCILEGTAQAPLNDELHQDYF